MKSSANPDDSRLFTRRNFLRTTCLSTAAAWTVPAFLDRTMNQLHAEMLSSAVQATTGKDSTILVLVQLAGGNDGLNTLVPYGDDAYHQARPRLGLKDGDVLKINDYVGLNAGLKPLQKLYDNGDAAFIQGVGYPNPNRSHFRSTEIWQTAVDSDKTSRHGWLGRYFDNCCQGADPTVGVAIGSETPQAFVGESPAGVTFTRPETFRYNAGDIDTETLFRELNEADTADLPVEGGSIGMVGGAPGGSSSAAEEDVSNLDFLHRVALDAQVSSDQVTEIAKKHRATAEYPSSPIAGQLHLVARMIAGGLSSRVYYVSQGGYDTHSGQANAHPRLINQLGEALGAFAADLKGQGNWERVMVLTFSEFGRRVAENGSAGTDHGAAAPMFAMGGKVKPGLFGQYPSLTQLDKGDLIHNVDFRSVYATVLERWLGCNSQAVLGRRFAQVPFIG